MSDYSPANVFHRRSRHNPPHSDTHRHTLNFSKLTRTLCPTLYPDSAAARLRAAGGVTPERGSGERDGASGAVTRATDLADSLNVAKKKLGLKKDVAQTDTVNVCRKITRRPRERICRKNLRLVCLYSSCADDGGKQARSETSYRPPPLRTRHVPLTGCDVTEFLLFIV